MKKNFEEPKSINEQKYCVIKRNSHDLFNASPTNAKRWKRVIDFTEIQNGGVDIKELIKNFR